MTRSRSASRVSASSRWSSAATSTRSAVEPGDAAPRRSRSRSSASLRSATPENDHSVRNVDVVPRHLHVAQRPVRTVELRHHRPRVLAPARTPSTPSAPRHRPPPLPPRRPPPRTRQVTQPNRRPPASPHPPRPPAPPPHPTAPAPVTTPDPSSRTRTVTEASTRHPANHDQQHHNKNRQPPHPPSLSAHPLSPSLFRRRIQLDQRTDQEQRRNDVRRAGAGVAPPSELGERPLRTPCLSDWSDAGSGLRTRTTKKRRTQRIRRLLK